MPTLEFEPMGMTMWPKCLQECPNWPVADLEGLGMMVEPGTPDRIYHGMNLTYICKPGKMMEDGNTTWKVPCSEGAFNAPNPRKWPKCLTVCNVTTHSALDTSKFVRCIEDQEEYGGTGECLTQEEFELKYKPTTTTTTTTTTTSTTTTSTTTTSTTTTTTTTTTMPEDVNVACWQCSGTDYLCSSETDNGNLEYCWPNITSCSLVRLTDRATSQVKLWNDKQILPGKPSSPENPLNRLMDIIYYNISFIQFSSPR